MNKSMPGVLGVFSHMDSVIESIKQLKASGRKDLKVFSPCPRHEIEEALDEKVSPVRRFTLFGGVLGCTLGYLFTSLTSLDWILPTSGKPIVAPVPFTVIAFEMTVLFGSIITIIGVILNAKLFRKRKVLYDERFTDDKFGIFIPCGENDYDAVGRALREQGAEEVKHA